MEFAAILLVALVVYAAVATIATVVAVIRDGRGHTPLERSTRAWSAGNLPSEPYASLRSLR